MHLRPRFGLPVLRRPGTANSATELPWSGLSGSRAGSIAASLVAGSLLLAACSTAEGDSMPAGGEPTTGGAVGDGATGDDVGDEVADGGETVALGFGDPVESGFDEVINTDVEPEKTPPSAQEILSRPDEVLPEITEQLETPDDGQEILDTVDVIDTAADAATDRDGRSRNSAGELAILDEDANLACAHVEVALSQLDIGNTSVAIERIWQAADRAGASGIAAVREWQEPLSGVIADGSPDDVAPLIGFITVCAEGGYEL